MLPPGRARLVTRPSLTGSLPKLEHDRNRRGRGLGSECSHRRLCGDHGNPAAHQLGRQHRQPLIDSIRRAAVDRYVFFCHFIAVVGQSLSERGGHLSLGEAATLSVMATR